MGADLLTANLWSKPDVTLDWEAGLHVARELSDESCAAMAEQGGWEPDDEEAAPEEMRAHTVRYVEVLRNHLTGWSRDLNTITTPDGRWLCWLTGGLSWGDSPSDLYDAINDLYAVPQVLEAIGFYVATLEEES